MSDQLVRLGRELSTALDQGAPELDRVRGRHRLLSAASKRRRSAWLAPLCAALALALGVVGWWLVPRADTFEFRVGDARTLGHAGDWIAAGTSRVPLYFDDGTKLVLFEGARARVSESSAKGANVVVERGTLRAAVRRRAGASWNLTVGPFDVHVTGTEFDVGWEPAREEFLLTLRQGSVTVSGPVIGSNRVVVASETLRVSCKHGELRLSRATAAAPSAPVSVSPPHPIAELTPPPASSAPELRAPRAPSLGHLEQLRTLARASEYSRAVAVAEAAGFAELCRSASEDDLLLLGDAARLALRPARAEEAYRAVRARFSGKSAARAGFMLGRLAFDGRGDYATAGRYFALSLLEEPSGPFSREAAGRLIESLERSGDSAGTRAAAARYLERFPDGPHATLARTLAAAP
jgi:transmembrane sensor